MDYCYVSRNGSSDWPRFVEVTVGASNENGFKEKPSQKVWTFHAGLKGHYRERVVQRRSELLRHNCPHLPHSIFFEIPQPVTSTFEKQNVASFSLSISLFFCKLIESASFYHRKIGYMSGPFSNRITLNHAEPISPG